MIFISIIIQKKMEIKYKKFTFAVFAYNQEHIVVETLESIKYQIIKYGTDYSFQLYVTDDCSNDLTFDVVNKWIKQNCKLFIKCQAFCNKKNMGTVYNYNLLMNCIENEQFKIIAGDDVIGPNSIFADLSEDENMIDTFPFYKLCDNKIYTSKLYLYDYFYRKKNYTKQKNLKWMRKGDFMHTPSTFYSKKLYDMGNCAKENARFFLFEDDPSFYMMLKSNNNIFIRFHESPLILYRYSASSTSTVPNQKFLEDWLKLQEMYYTESRGLEKIYFYFRKNSMTFGKINLYKIIDRIRQIYRILFVLFRYRNEFNIFYYSFLNEIDEMQVYYNNIKKKANIFYENIEEII